MINDKLIDVFLQNAEQEDLIRGIKEILNHFKIDSEYRYEELVNISDIGDIIAKSIINYFSNEDNKNIISYKDIIIKYRPMV